MSKPTTALLNQEFEWALSKDAREAHKLLIDSGVDPDLAFELLHKIFKEKDLYELGEVDFYEHKDAEL